MAHMEFDLKAELISLGAANDAIRLLDEPNYRLINYIDLIKNLRPTGKSGYPITQVSFCYAGILQSLPRALPD